MSKNPYDVLGVPQNASDDEIKKAYRELTRKHILKPSKHLWENHKPKQACCHNYNA